MPIHTRFAPLFPFACVLALWVAQPAAGFIDTLEIAPAMPTCTDNVTVAVNGAFPDQCWEVISVRLVNLGSELRFEVRAVDHGFPGVACAMALQPYSGSEVVGTLPGGAYTLSAVELVSSWRTTGDSQTLPFSVTCLTRPPGAVSGLQVARTAAGDRELTWTAVPGADEYAVWASDDPDGPFDSLVATSVVPRVALPLAGATYHVVSARNAWGEGPRR